MTTSTYVLLLVQLLALFDGKLTVESTELPEKEWWETTLVYQILPRSFQDSDGDGVGDLKGIIDRLDYIKGLGVETIWLNPIYSSPLLDSGYDVANHMDIHPVFGTFEDFDKLVQEAHNRGLKIILDIIPNHSSDQHQWFQLSTQNIEPYKDYYVWADGVTNENGEKYPPNNWVSTYSDKDGSAWTWNDAKKQWYYHKFHESQPDLNLRNKNVIDELRAVFDFWLQRGVDGFRISAVPYFFEDNQLRNKTADDNDIYTFGLHENTELLYVFRAYISNWIDMNNSTSKLLIAESDDVSDNLIHYYGNTTHEGIPPFNFHFIKNVHNDSKANHIRDILQKWLDLLPENTSTNWVLSNHDNSRATSRIGSNRVDGLHMLTLLLPGQAFTYYGEEIGMMDGKLTWNETIDPMGRSHTEDTYEQYSRDPARTPMQWNTNVSAGFSTNKKPYLPVHPDYARINVELQQNENYSNLNIYKTLARLRKDATFIHGDYEFNTLNNDNVLILRRSLTGAHTYFIVINMGMQEEKVDLILLYPNLSKTMEVVIASKSNTVHVNDIISSNNIVLPANAALVLKTYTSQSTTEITGETTTTGPETTSSSYETTMEIETTTNAIPSTTTAATTTTTGSTIPTTTTSKPTTVPVPVTTTTPATVTTEVSTTTIMTTTTKTDGDNSSSNMKPLSILILSTTFAVTVLFGKF